MRGASAPGRILAGMSTLAAPPARTSLYPFSAIVGQNDAKHALVLNAIDPSMGGVLLSGEKGTAKSTIVRALTGVLPGEPPLRTLPLGATEDRLEGGIDVEASLREGRAVFSPGLLADVDGGVLYVDEVNLLPDHLVDAVLSAAASGEHRVEREGFSVVYPSRFALIGTMNPEEGDVRPQLLDRFGLCVQVKGEADPSKRVAVMRRRIAYDADPTGFAREYAEQDVTVTSRIEAARAMLHDVVLDARVRSRISTLAVEAHAAGLRADVVWAKAAVAHAAWDGRDGVTVADVMDVGELVLRHRRREAAPPPPPAPQRNQESDEAPTDEGTTSDEQAQPDAADAPDTPGDSDQGGQNAESPDLGGVPPHEPESSSDDSDANPENTDGDEVHNNMPSDQAASGQFEVGESFSVADIAPITRGRARTNGRASSGKRHAAVSATSRGRYMRARRTSEAQDLAVDATLRAAAPHQIARRASAATGGPRIVVDRSDWHRKIREQHVGTCVVFVVDASGSMGARGRMTATKGAILSLLLDAYQKRDKVALITFHRDGANVLLPPTSSVDVAGTHLRELHVGGRTPLAAGLVAAHELVQPLLHREAGVRPLVVVLSDGRANLRLDGSRGNGVAEAQSVAQKLSADDSVSWVVVDTEDDGRIQLGLAKPLATALGARYTTIDDMRADDLVSLVRDVR